ncbi:hypothetical protein L7F22_026046 [Adiantum nelumboides]|nr:hypothetical protein [Adiantum nelumboides]
MWSAFHFPHCPSQSLALSWLALESVKQLESQVSASHFSPKLVANTQSLSQPFMAFDHNYTKLMNVALYDSQPDMSSPLMITSATTRLFSHPSSLSNRAAPHVASPTTNHGPSPAANPIHPLPSTPPPTSISPTVLAPSLVSSARPPTRSNNVTHSSSGTSSSRRKKSSDIWSVNNVNVLLDLYEDKWISLNRGNFKAKHWTEIARDILAQIGVVFTEFQCKNKWENMKKSFMKEKQKESATGAEPSRWEYFARMEDLLGGTPKVSGLNDDFTGEQFVNPDVVSLAEDEDMCARDDEGGAAMGEEEEVNVQGSATIDNSTNMGPADTNDEEVVPSPSIGQAVQGQRVKKQKTMAALKGLGGSIERGCGVFAKTLERVEIRRLELEEKRLDVQVQIARLGRAFIKPPPPPIFESPGVGSLIVANLGFFGLDATHDCS